MRNDFLHIKTGDESLKNFLCCTILVGEFGENVLNCQLYVIRKVLLFLTKQKSCIKI